MDMSALWDLSYGLYAVGVKDGERLCGCIANAAVQVRAEPPSLMISICKDNFTESLLKKGGSFTLSILSELSPPLDITYLGFQSGRERDKFANVAHALTADGTPYLTSGTCGYLDCRVTGSYDCDTHTAFFADVVDARKLSENAPMSYAFYHSVIKGKAPKNAPTFRKWAGRGKYKGGGFYPPPFFKEVVIKSEIP